MWNPDTKSYMSDDLERRLLQQAIEEELRFRPANGFKKLIARLFRKKSTPSYKVISEQS